MFTFVRDVLLGTKSIECLRLAKQTCASSDAMVIAEAMKMNESIKTLVMRDNSIDSDCLADALRVNSTITHLDLCRCNGRSSLIEAIATNQALLWLDLSSCRGLDGIAVAKLLKSNNTLQYLDLNNTSLTGVSEIGVGLAANSSLKHLFLSSCFGESAVAKSMGDALLLNTTLCTLDLSNNSISSKGLRYLCSMLLTNRTLTHLNLRSNTVCEIGMCALAEVLKVNHVLKELYLDDNIATNIGLAALANSLRVNWTLRRLTVTNNFEDDEDEDQFDVSEHIDALRFNGSLIEYAVGNCNSQLDVIVQRNRKIHDFARESVVALMAVRQFGRSHLIPREVAQIIGMCFWTTRFDVVAWEGKVYVDAGLVLAPGTSEQFEHQVLNVCSSDHVDVIANSLVKSKSVTEMYLVREPTTFTDEQLERLFKSLEANKSVTKLMCHKGVLKGASGLSLARLLSVNSTVKHVLLGDNMIESAAVCLGQALAINRSVTELNVSANNIPQPGVGRILKAVQVNNVLSALDLSDNPLGVQLGQHIGKLLKENRSLKSLNLRCSAIGDAGVAAIANGLLHNEGLTQLNLANTSPNCMEIAEALQVNRCIKDLDVSGNLFGPRTALAFCESLKLNRTLTALRFGGNCIQLSGARGFADALKVNHTLKLLDLKDNVLGKVGLNSIAHALVVNDSITSIDLVYNADNLSDFHEAMIEHALWQNGTIIECNFNFSSDTSQDFCIRNRTMHRIAKNCVLTLIGLQRFGQTSVIPWEVANLIGIYLWNTRADVKAWSRLV